jgi:uncharacterized NAD(P)/FAD-binding protein YdhS
MSCSARFDVAVIGAGASGALVMAQLRRQAPEHGRLALIGAGPRAARGVAYETHYQTNRLNVAAGNMSAFPDDREHFVRWLSAHLPGTDARTFAPRTVYGDYLADILAEDLPGATVFSTPHRAIGLYKESDQWIVYLDDGNTLAAHAVALALGNLAPNDPFNLGPETPSAYFRNPWAANVADGLAPDAPVVLIGTGLTMVDVALALREQGHRGPLSAISHHGRLPQAHATYSPRPLAQLPQAFDAPYSALGWVRDEISASDGNWRAVIDSLRPHTAAIWRGWTLPQRASFLRHARNLWDIHRHRMAPEVAAQVGELLQSGTLSISQGRPVALESVENGLIVTWRETGSGALQQIRAARVVNCTGPNRDYRRVNSPLLTGLRQRGWLTTDALQLGWKTDAQGQLIGANGDPVSGLFTIGPLRIPDLWESVAIPEIRTQAADLAALLVSETVQYAQASAD